MKLINFSFICILIFMIENLYIICPGVRAISNDDPDFDNDDDKDHNIIFGPVGIEIESNQVHYIRIKYANDIKVKWKGSGTTNHANEEQLSAGDELKITFNSTELETITPDSFFKNKDDNYGEITFIDLSNLHSSLTSLSGLFTGCEKLEEVFLSSITTKKIENYSSMLADCKNLKVLDISNLVFSGYGELDGNYGNFGLSTEKLEYLDIKGAKLSNQIKRNLIKNFNSLNNFKICQESPTFTDENVNYVCCDYKDKDGECDPENYMIMSYKDNGEYLFSYPEKLKDNMIFIIFEDFSSNRYGLSKTTVLDQLIEYDNRLSLDPDSIIYIYFTPFSSLESLFEGNSDIKSVDLSHLDFSGINSAKNMLKNSKIEEINLSNINAPKLSNIDSMFENCTELVSITLNNFTTQNGKSVENLFKDTKNLKVLEMSNFDLSSQTSEDSLFEEYQNLLYLNIKGLQGFNSNIKEKLENIIQNNKKTIVCENGEINKNNKDNEFKCCNYMLNFESCESFNYITVKYKLEEGSHDIKRRRLINNIEYREGFGIGIREGKISYVMKEDEMLGPKQHFFVNYEHPEIKIYFPEKVKSLKDMFSNQIDSYVEYIESIDFSNFNSSLVTDMSNLFYGCYELISVVLSELKTQEVTNMNSMFYGCKSLASIDLLNFDTSKVTDMGSMFLGCDKLEFVQLQNFDTSSVTNMNSMFHKCNSLTSIDLFNFNTSKVTNMGSMFEECNKLEFVKLHHFDTSSVYNMTRMFYNCKSLLFIDISCFNLENVEQTYEIFEGLTKIKYANLYNVEDSKGIITSSNLNNVEGLMVCQKDHLITKEGITNACCYFKDGNCIVGTYNLFRIIFASDVEYPNGFGDTNRNNIKFIIDKGHYDTSNSDKSVSFIAGYIYEIYLESPGETLENYFNSEYDSNSTKIKSIDVICPNSSSVTSLDSMFKKCTSLESVSLVYIDTSKVTSFSAMFRECSSLKKVDLSYLDTSSAEDMSQMFQKCKSLEFIDVSSFNTSSVTKMNNMFAECESLEILDLSYFDTPKLDSMSSMFFRNIKLKVLDISSFNLGKVNSVNVVFSGLISLKYINLYNAKDPKYYINESYLQNIDNLTICEKEDIIISQKNAYYNCCYYDIKTNKCEADNYMLIYYDQDVTYEQGFSYNPTDVDKFRNEKYFIINNYLYPINETSKFEVKKNSKLEIYFTTEITTLENYFNAEIDTNAKYIKKVILSHLHVNSIDSTSYMFNGCSNLKSVDFSNIEISGLNKMNFMFHNCESLEYVDLSDFNTSLVDEMESMFEGCKIIELIDLSYFDISSVNNMANMFNGCEKLKILDIPSFSLESIENVDGIFTNTGGLSYINLYNAKKKYNATFEKNEFKGWKELTVCQKERIISKNKNERCCYFNNGICESTNYIVIYFEKETIYKNGFIKDNTGKTIRNKNDIDFIINGNHFNKYKATDKLFIKKGKKIKVYFSSVTTLENYFSVANDPNMENVVSMDLSHFNTSLVTNMASMFNGCHSLKSIDLYDINTSSVEDMSNMFKDCSGLEILDLSSFDTSLVTNINSMFNECESLIYLDISNFNLENIKLFNSVFTGLDNLQYLNLYYIKNSDEYITNSELNELEDVTVCQKDYLVTNENATYKCCYYDIEKKKCINDNFALIYYGQEVNYARGFGNYYRKGKIDFIINRDRNSPLSDTDKFIVKKGYKIEVYFYSDLTSLEFFFSKNSDGNMGNAVVSIDLSNLKTSSVTSMTKMFFNDMSLKSIDLSNIDTSSVKDMSYMFYDCLSLESIDLSYFETSLVEDMEYMFAYCKLLKVIDLSYFNTPKVTKMWGMFNGCDSLQLLDISHFNLEGISYAGGVFWNLYNLSYINIYYITDTKGKLTNCELNQNIYHFTVCQRENIITESTDNRCCYFNLTSQKCENQNYITLFFGDKTIYNKGFENDEDNTIFREGIKFIINGEDHNKKLTGKDKLYLHRGSKLEIYFSDEQLSLQNYFSAAKDPNMKNLVSVYLSNLNLTVSENFDNLFYNCVSLKTIVDLNDIITEQIVNMSHMFYNCSSL